MIKIGLTGNIGSGKSLVSEILLSAGIPVFNADSEAKKILFSAEIVPLLTEHFGQDVFTNQKPDKAKIAALIFSDSRHRNTLNQIIHPLVRTAFNTWCEVNSGADIVVMEAAIMIESGLYKIFDKVVYVFAPVEMRLKRIMKRENCTEEMALQRMAAQWTDEEKIPYADTLIINDEKAALLPQVLSTFSIQ